MAQGSITKRVTTDGKARYLVRVEYPPDPVTGKRRQRAKTFATRKEAEGALATWLVEIERGTALEPSKLTVGEYLQHWLETVTPALRPSTAERYAGLIRTHLVPALGNIPLQKLTAAHVQAFYASRLAGGRADGKPGGLSPRSIRFCHTLLHAALDQAMRWGLTNRNVTDAAEPPRAVRPPVRTWDVAQLRRFLAIAETDEHYGPIWLVAVATGLRRGELVGLQWDDVDLTSGRLHIRRALVELNGRISVTEPKTASGRRVVPVPPEVVAALRQHRARQQAARLRAGPAWRNEGWVFTVEDGGPVGPRNLNRRFAMLTARAGLPPIPFHGLRHAHATALLRAGIPAKVVAERLGHSQISLTLDTYSHVLPDMQAPAVAAISAALFGDEAAASVNTA